MSRIEESKDPFPLGREKAHDGADVQMGEESKVLAVANPAVQVNLYTLNLELYGFLRFVCIFIYFLLKETLDAENVPDPMDAEQTWPTDEELALADAQQKRKIVKRVPKGTSEYQAAWIPDEDGGLSINFPSLFHFNLLIFLYFQQRTWIIMMMMIMKTN